MITRRNWFEALAGGLTAGIAAAAFGMKGQTRPGTEYIGPNPVKKDHFDKLSTVPEHYRRSFEEHWDLVVQQESERLSKAWS